MPFFLQNDILKENICSTQLHLKFKIPYGIGI